MFQYKNTLTKAMSKCVVLECVVSIWECVECVGVCWKMVGVCWILVGVCESKWERVGLNF